MDKKKKQEVKALEVRLSKAYKSTELNEIKLKNYIEKNGLKR
jgi:hypothetical protein